MEERDFERIRNNKNIKEEDKEAIFKLFDYSRNISFGKISPRLDGYLINGAGYPRCTSIMSMDGSKAAMLADWAKKEIVSYAKTALVSELNKTGKLTEETINFFLDLALENPDTQRDTAAFVGTNVHDNIERWLNGDSFEPEERLFEFQRIWEKEKVELVCTELPLIYVDDFTGYGFGGRMDILAYKDGEFIIYDNKTSKSLHQGYALQVSAYKAAVEQMSKGLIKVSKAKLVHLPDLTSLKDWQLKAYEKLGNLVECKNLDGAFKHYEILLSQYYYRNNKYF